jgi:hypothetical protein
MRVVTDFESVQNSTASPDPGLVGSSTGPTMSIGVWIAIGVAIVGLIALARFSGPRRRGDVADLGSVSEQWISEHRAGQWGDRR